MCSRHKGEKDCILYLLSTFAVAFKTKQLQKTRSTRWQHTQIWTIKVQTLNYNIFMENITLHASDGERMLDYLERTHADSTQKDLRLGSKPRCSYCEATVLPFIINTVQIWAKVKWLMVYKLLNRFGTITSENLPKCLSLFFKYTFTYLSCWGVSLHNDMLTPNAIFFSVLFLQFNFQCVSLCSWINTPITE